METYYLKNTSSEFYTGIVDLANYFEDFKEATKSYTLQNKTADELCRLGLPLSNEQFLTLRKTCSPELLAMEGENPTVDVAAMHHNPSNFEKTEIPSDVDLQTFHLLKERSKFQVDCTNLRVRSKNQIYLNEECRRLKPNMTVSSDFVITIRIFYPFHIAMKSTRPPVRCNQEVTVIGRNTLAKLKDVIMCMEEYGDLKGDVSENPFAPVRLRLKDVYKSGMFYIGDTFYIDQRNPDNIDYSMVIREWGAKRNLCMNKVESMESTQICDLKVRFGFPYVYQHLGNCEHLLVFSNARLLHKDDILAEEQYPLYMSLSLKVAKSCALCGTTIAKFIVTGSERLTRDPSFLCELCLKNYMYLGKGKIGSFKVFRFYDRRAMI